MERRRHPSSTGAGPHLSWSDWVWLGVQVAGALVITVIVVGVGVSVITDPPTRSTTELQRAGLFFAAAELATLLVSLPILYQRARGVPGAGSRTAIWFVAFAAWMLGALVVGIMVTAASST